MAWYVFMEYLLSSFTFTFKIFVSGDYKIGYDERLLKWKPSIFNTADFLLHIPGPSADRYQLFCRKYDNDNNKSSSRGEKRRDKDDRRYEEYDKTDKTSKSRRNNDDGWTVVGKKRDENTVVVNNVSDKRSSSSSKRQLESFPGLEFVDYVRADEQFRKAGDWSIVECYWHREPNKASSRRGEWKFLRHRTDKTDPNADWVVRKIIASLDKEISEDALSKATSSMM